MHTVLQLMCVLVLLCSQWIEACKYKYLRPGRTFLLNIKGSRRHFCIDVETDRGHRLVMDCTGKDRYFETNPKCHDSKNMFYFGNFDEWTWNGCGTKNDLVLRSDDDYFIADYFARKKYQNGKFRGIKCDIRVEKDAPIPTTKPAITTSAVTTSTKPAITTAAPGSSCDCGKRNNNAFARIVNGKETLRNEYPFFAGLVEKRRKREVVCGASLISKRWVLSAVHCHYPGETFLVVLGGHHVDNFAPSNYYDVERMIKHENYKKRTTENDVMLLKLSKAVEYSATISPVCLPSKSFTDATYNKLGVVMGYGLTTDGKNGQQAKALRHVQLPIITPEKCRTYPYAYYQTVTKDMICTYQDGKDNCGGDSGGPLVFARNGRLTQVGIVSWGGATCAGKNMPAAYMKVEHYIDWIKKNTNEEFCFN